MKKPKKILQEKNKANASPSEENPEKLDWTNFDLGSALAKDMAAAAALFRLILSRPEIMNALVDAITAEREKMIVDEKKFPTPAQMEKHLNATG